MATQNTNILVLSDDEIEFIENRYPDIDMDNLLDRLPGMEVLTYLDKLEALIKNDIEDLRIIAFDYEEYQAMLNQLKSRDDWPERQYAWKMLFSIGNKITHYRKYGSRQLDQDLPKEFTIEQYCKQADDLARKCIGVGIGNTYTDICIERIDKTIFYLKSLGRYLDPDSCWDFAVLLGTKLGELMLEDKLKERGYEWRMNDSFDVPVIGSNNDKSAINPIGKILKILESKGNDEGTCKDFYEIFLFMIREENRELTGFHSYFDIVKKAIDEWDPFGLLNMGCPEDEYDSESRVIANNIDSHSSLKEIAEAISEEINESFNESLTPGDCLQPAAKIYDVLQKVHFVGDR